MWETRLHPECEEELKSLKGVDNSLLSKTIYDIKLLREFGLELLKEDRVKKLNDHVYELRTRQGSNIGRTLFGVREGRLILLVVHFIKKTQKTPKGRIDLAEKRLDEWKRV
jgi:phage-related protein